MKEQLILDIKFSENFKYLKTIETFETGEYNETTLYFDEWEIVLILHNNFDVDLNGNFPGLPNTKILGWEIIEDEKGTL